jgi:pyruvate/2-oxoglutarate dehydrogenase complex dihydrolipoamide dehydrogenase (E3) component
VLTIKSKKLLTDIETWYANPKLVWNLCFPGVKMKIDSINSNDKTRTKEKIIRFLYSATSDGYSMNFLCVDMKRETARHQDSAAVKNHKAAIIGCKDNSAEKILLTTGSEKLSLMDPKILGGRIPNLLTRDSTKSFLPNDKSSTQAGLSGIKGLGIEKVSIY